MLNKLSTWPRTVTLILAALLAAAGPQAGQVAGADPAAAQPRALAPAFVSPHLFAHFAESPGSATDLTVYAFFASGLVSLPTSGGAMVEVYLFADDGLPLETATNVAVCNPCSAALSSDARSATISIEAIITANGGFPAGPAADLEGYGVVVVSQAGPDHVAVQISQKENGAVYELAAEELDASGVDAIAHFTEAPGTGTDVLFYLSYGAGQGSLPSGSGATEDIYVFAPDGQPLKSATNADVCNPCTFLLSSSVRHHVFRLENQIVAAGGLTGTVSGTVLMVTGGSDPLGLARLVVQRAAFATSYMPLVTR